MVVHNPSYILFPEVDSERIVFSCYALQNSICLIGEVLRDLPRPTDDPGLVWEALKAREVELTQRKCTS